MNCWEKIGIKLGLHNEKLTAIKTERLCKVQECCYDMLAHWVQFDVKASLEKLKEVVQSISDIEPMIATSDLMVNFKEYLCQLYSNMRVKNMVNTAFIYHQSKLATRKSVEAVAKAMYYGNIVINGDQCSNQQLMIEPKQDTDNYAQREKSTNILKLLTDLDSGPDREDPFLLLIEGAQGIGKTTTCKEIAFQWAKYRGLYGQFTFLISLHEINLGRITTFESFLEEIYHQSTVKNVAKDLQSSRGKKVMVIIDGYETLFDQQKYSVDSYIHRIINREIYELQQCDLVVSCHTASVKLYQCNNCTRIELLGFTEKAKHQYIEYALNYDEKYIGELMAYLKEQSTLYSLCYYPLCLCNLVHLFEECKFHGTKLPVDQTEVINKIANRIVLSLSGSKEIHFLPLTTAVGSMPKEYQSILNTIGELAFYSLQAKNIVFKLSDIKSDINSADVKKNCLGFLKVNSFQNTDINQMLFTFLHISLQEFLAAFYISTLSQCAQIWRETFWKTEFLNVWAYYCGIAGDNLLKNMVLGWFGIQKDILRNKIKCLYLVHCLMESPDSEIYQKVKPSVIANDVSLNLSSCTFTQEDFQILLLFLLRCKVKEWCSLDLSCCHIDDDKLIYFLQQLQSFVTSIPSIKVLNLPNNQLSKICLRNVFKMAVIFNTIKINLSGNEIEDQKICESVTFFTQSSDQSRINIIQNCESFFLLRCHNVLQDIKLISNLAHLYIIRCSLVNETIDDLLNALESYSTLSSVFFYDNTLLHLDLLKLLDGLTVLKWLKSVLIFEKTSLDILYKSSFKFILLSNIAALACHHQLAVLLQLNDCHIIDDVMSHIAVILNSSSQHWSLLDLSGSRIDDNTLRKFCNALYGNCTVDKIKLASNELSSSSLIVELIQCLNPNAIDICGNSFTTDDSNFALIVAEELFAHDKQLSLTLTCDGDIALFCQNLNLNAITAKLNTSSNFTQLFIDNCTLCSKTLLNSIDNYDTLTSLYLVHVQWSGDPFHNFTEFFEKNIFFSICENIIPRQALGILVSKFDVDVSRIISTNDIFIANKCSFNMLKLHLIQKISPLSLNINLFCILNCLLEDEPQNSSIISDYLSKQNMVTEIMLCNNGLSPKNVRRIIKTLKQLKLLKCIFIYELHKQLYGTKVARCLLHIFNCSFIIIENKVVIGNQANLEQLDRCLSLVSPSPTILRFISCSFGSEHYNTLVDVLSHHTTLEEFSLYECNINDIWTEQLVEALQVKSALTSLLLSCNKVTPLKADSIATALSAVINSNPTLEKVSVKFDNLPSSACGKIFQALSNVRHLKHFRFCDGQVTTKEAIDQLYKVIANNPSLEVVNLRNNKLQNLGVKALAKAFKNICHLKLLALNGNQIDEEAADDIASIIANNVKIEKLLLYNNALKSEGIYKVCQAMKCHANLKVFRIGQNYIQEEAADDIAEVINHNPLLKVVDIANNRLLTNGVMKITRWLEKITNLNLKENNITCTEKLAAYIAKSFTNNTYLKVLHLDNNNFSVSDVSIIAEAINKVTGLKVLTVSNTGFTADNISTMITNNLLLEILDIGDNKLESEGISHISKALMKLSHLRELGLYGNEITDDAAGDIAGVISRLPVLEKLWLSSNAFGVVGMRNICKSLQHNGTLKLLQLDNVGLTEEVADDIADLIHSNPLLEYVYLGSNRLQSTGANVILSSLKSKKQFKALALNNNCISEDVVNNVVQFVTSNPELEELLLNGNSIGTTGILKVYYYLKNINTLKFLNLADNNVKYINDKAGDPIVSVIESNTSLEKISLDGNILFDNTKLLSTIAKLSKLKYLQIDCKRVTENYVDELVDELVDFIFANSNVEEITVKHFTEEIHFLSPSKAIETVVVIKANSNESVSHMPVLHSVVMEKKVEIVCVKNNGLVKSEVMKLIKVKTVKRLVLVFTKRNYCTNQEIAIDFIMTLISDCRNIYSLKFTKLNDNQCNSDVSVIVIIEEDTITIMLRGDSLKGTGITKLLNKFVSITNLVLCSENISDFTSQSSNEIVDIISKTTKLEKFTFRTDAIPMKAMENVINLLTKTITIQTISVLHNLNIRNFDFIHKRDKTASQELETQVKTYIICALRNNVDLRTLDFSGTAINEDVARYLANSLNKITTLEVLSLKDCSLGVALKSIRLQKVTTLKYLNLSNNNLIEDEPIITTLESNTMLEKLFIDKNHLKPTAGDKLCIAIRKLNKLKALSIDQNIIRKDMTLTLAAAFSTPIDNKLFIYNHVHQSTEMLDIKDPLHNITTLILCKRSVGIKNISFLAAFIKTGVVLSLWDQDNALSKAEVIKSLSASRIITTIKLLNVSGKRLTVEEEDAIATIIKENTQLENVLLGRQSHKSVVDDFYTFHRAHNIDYEVTHHKAVSTSNTNTTDEPIPLSQELILNIVSEIKCYANLKTLDLSSIVITKELAILLVNCIKLEKLILAGCFLGNESVDVISNSLKNITALKYLDLSNTNITEHAQILEATTGLERLDLEKNHLPTTAGDKLSVAIANLKYLKVLNVDQSIICSSMITAFSTAVDRRLLIHNHDHQSNEVMDIRGPLSSINTLTMCKFPMDKLAGPSVIAHILETGTVLLVWTHSDILSTTGLLTFFSDSKQITTIKLLNISCSELTEPEVDTIATVISENVQIKRVWLGTHSVKTIADDFRADRMSENNIPNHPEQLESSFKDNTAINKIPQLFPNNLLLKILCALQNITELRTLDLSGNVITEELAEQLAIVLANSTKLETLLLEDCSLGNEGVNVIANSLKNVTTLKQLWLSWNNITEVTADNIMAVLECNTGLEEVYLDGSLQPFNNFSVAIKKNKLKILQMDYKLIAYDKTYELANSIINNSKLKCLILKNYALQVTSILVFKSHSENIKSLSVGKVKTNMIANQDPSTVMAFVDDSNIMVACFQNNILASTGIMRVVSVFKGVTSVTLFNYTLDEYTNEDIDEIMIPIANFSELEELNMMEYSTTLQNHVLHSLSNCKLNSLLRVDMSCRKIHATKLSSLLFNNRKLQELCLNHCLLASSQVTEITNALKTHTGIKSLRLNSNNITDVPSVADHIGQILLKNQSMQKFHICNNRLQAKGVIKILEVLKQLHNVNELTVGSNNITNSISDIAEEIRFYDLLVEVITNNLNMEILGIDKVCKHADGVAKVVMALKSLSYLKLLDMPSNNINKESADDIAVVITNNTNLTKLYIADNYLGATGVTKIAKALVSSGVLEVLDIANNSISVEAAESITEIIKNNPQLKVLLLGNNCLIKKEDNLNSDDNKLVRDILSTMNLSDVFINKQILESKQNTKIYGPQHPFSYCIIKSGSFCCKLFLSNSVLDSSHSINFNNNTLQSKGIKSVSQALATINLLEVLSIENNDVDDQAASDIASALISNNGIKQLWIGKNHFTPSGISTILQSFLEKPRLSLLQLLFGATPEDSAEPTLEVLDLSYSNLSERTAVDISAVLSKNHNIQQLWLEGNNLSQCITTITDALKKCTNISVLSLRDDNISEEVADVLSEVLSKNSNLQQLYLGNNHLQDRGVIKITETLNTTEYLLALDLMNNNISEAAADALASVITSCSQLEQLYLGDNKLQSTGTIKIARAIQQANRRSTLRVLDLSNNRIGSDETVRDEISRAVANTELLTVLILDDNAFSVNGVWKITRSLNQSEYMMIFSVMRNDVMISEETKDEMRAVMAYQQPDCVIYL